MRTVLDGHAVITPIRSSGWAPFGKVRTNGSLGGPRSSSEADPASREVRDAPLLPARRGFTGRLSHPGGLLYRAANDEVIEQATGDAGGQLNLET